MPVSDAAPVGRVQGSFAYIQHRTYGMDGMSQIASGDRITHTLHSLYATAKLCMQLAEELESAGTCVVEMKRRA